MDYDKKLLRYIRCYLKYSDSYVSKKNGITISDLNDIEFGSDPIPDFLIQFYANSLGVRYIHLDSILSSSKKTVGSRGVNKFLKRYFSLIYKLREYEKKK